MQYIKTYLFLSFTLAYCYGKNGNAQMKCGNGTGEFNYLCDMDGNQTDCEDGTATKGVCDDTLEKRLDTYEIDWCSEKVRNLTKEFQTSFKKMPSELLYVDNETVSTLTKSFNKPVNIIFITDNYMHTTWCWW